MARQRRAQTNVAAQNGSNSSSGSSPSRQKSAADTALMFWQTASGALFVALVCVLFVLYGRTVNPVNGPGSSMEFSTNLVASVDAALGLIRRNPAAAVQLMEDAVTRTEFQHQPAGVKATVLDTLGDAKAAALKFGEAKELHLLALNEKHKAKAGLAEIAVSLSSMATDSTSSFEDPSIALGYLEQAQSLPNLPAEAVALLLRQEADVHECADDVISALQRFEHAAKLHPQSAQDVERQLKHLQLLRQTLASAGDKMPQQVRQGMEGRARRIISTVLSTGPWQHPQQLPHSYIPGLYDRPWHDLDDRKWAQQDEANKAASDWMIRAAKTLAESTPALRTEYDILKQAGQLHRQTECIHRRDGGGWWSFELNGIWEARGADGCALVSPTACKLFARLQEEGMPLIRAAYSAVGPGAHLKPHCGTTNGQLKWHLGVTIPAGDCALLRVANETRAWKEGQILFFDDSFEHEVVNNCREERVVFQLVFVHPDASRQVSEQERKRSARH